MAATILVTMQITIVNNWKLRARTAGPGRVVAMAEVALSFVLVEDFVFVFNDDDE